MAATVDAQKPSQDQQKYLNKLAGANVLIIGGTSGIGFALAELAVEHGMRVTVSSSSDVRVAEAVARLQKSYPSKKQNIEGFSCDLGEHATMESNIIKLLEHVKTTHGVISHVVYTAGGRLATAGLADVNVEEIVRHGNLRLFAPILLAKHIPEYVEAAHTSTLTLTTGIGAVKFLPGMTITSAYLGALVQVTKNLALDLKPIRVNAVMPGGVDSEFWDFLEPAAKAKMMKSWAGEVLTGRVGRPVDVAEAYHYIWRDEFVTGSVVQTDGGHTLVNIGGTVEDHT